MNIPWLAGLLPFLLGTGIGVVLFQGMGTWATKWFLFAVAGILGLSFLALLRPVSTQTQRRHLLLFLAVFALPMQFVDVNFGFIYNYPYTVLANGYNVGLADVFFGLLFLGWLGEVWAGRVPIVFPRFLILVFLLHLAVDLFSAFFIAREPFFAFSLIWRELKVYWLVFFLANFLRDAADLRVIGYAMAAILAFEALVVLEQQTLGVIFTAEHLGYETYIVSRAGPWTIKRLAGTLGHPNTLAAFLNTAMIWIWFMIPSEKRFDRRVLLAIALVMGLGASMATGSRAGWLGLGVAISLGMWGWLKKQGKNPLVGMGVIILTLVIGFSTLFAVSETFRTRLTKGDAGAAMVRVPLMRVASEVIRDRPWTGVGLGQYVQSMELYDRTLLRLASTYNQPVHNAFLLRAAETGIPGLLTMLLLVGSLIYYGWWVFKRAFGIYADAGLTASLALIAWSIQQQANPDNLHMAVILWVTFGAMLAVRRRLILEGVRAGAATQASAIPARA